MGRTMQNDVDPGIREIMERLFEDGIKPNLTRILDIARRDRIPVLMFEPSEGSLAAARNLGAHGEALFSLSKKKALRVLGDVDKVTGPWIKNSHPEGGLHLLVFVHGGSLLLCYDPERGWYPEPGSLDADTGNWAH
jgi:hypothetical protein